MSERYKLHILHTFVTNIQSRSYNINKSIQLKHWELTICIKMYTNRRCGFFGNKTVITKFMSGPFDMWEVINSKDQLELALLKYSKDNSQNTNVT